MSQSIEALAMYGGKSETSIQWGKSKGFTVSKGLAAAFVGVFLSAVVATGLLVYYFAPCPYHLTGEDSGRLQESRTKGKLTDVRLPTSLLPDLYKVKLIPFLVENNFTIDGEVWINMNCTVATDNVTLHINEIKVQEDTVTVKDLVKNKAVRVRRHSYDKERQFYTVHLQEMLQPYGRYQIYIKFQGDLNDNLHGFYRSSYEDMATGEKRWLGVTQFQPTDARRAFPCFDEPGMKARFEISLGRWKNMSTISNMPIRSKETIAGNEDWEWDHYTVSVPMSTYLVAFVVSDFASQTSNSTLSDTKFRVWARTDALAQAEYARDIGPRILEHFERYFNVSFPLPKQDMIALPDFSAGAMENWGLITYRETAMLYDPQVSSARNKQRVAVVVSHELAHQWFGNLVTPAWWTDLWLNEGFASYVEYIGVEHVHPDWKVLEQFVVDDLQDVFSTDALESSHPISIPVKNPDEINEIFDRISYGKGASIIRMMNHFLTEKTFRSGLTNYLKEMKYGSAEMDDLWSALTKQAHLHQTLPPDVKVKDIMDSWTLQMGYPVITVVRDYQANTATLSQSRFLLFKNAKSKSKDNHDYKWWVPLTFTTEDQRNWQNTRPQRWMMKNQTSIVMNRMPGEDKWVIFNILETGYYRVNYDRKNWEMLVATLANNHRAIGVVNRAQVLDDALNLARAGLLSYEIALKATMYLKEELEYLPWTAALEGLSFIDTMFSRTGGYGILKKYMLQLVEVLYKRVGFEEKDTDDHLDIYNRINALSWACFLGNKDCVTRARTKYQQWMNSSDPDTVENNPISPNLKRVIYCTAVKHGGEREWNFAWERYLKSNVGSEKSMLLDAMGCTQEVWILSRYLNWSLSENSGIRKQDGSHVFRVVSYNTVGRYLAFDFLRDQWDRIKEFYGAGFFAVSSMVTAVTSSLNTPFEVKELHEFQKEHKEVLGTATRALEQSIEKAEANVAWMNKNYQTVYNWLQKHIKEG